ncbi:unnamed protein product [Phytophthora lilii]|uniref:Unnamed protein product n=1 Tax=Phytophthora lilii TaxID=2077276 RepID=A0A9W6TGP9_9STRA|nr:unnamed protein product [Phytophthora lilii]
MGMTAQFSGQARLNAPEEEVIIVKKRETKSTEPEPAAQAKPGGNDKPNAKAKNDQEEKPVEHEDDPEIVIERKHCPPKPGVNRPQRRQRSSTIGLSSSGSKHDRFQRAINV